MRLLESPDLEQKVDIIGATDRLDLAWQTRALYLLQDRVVKKLAKSVVCVKFESNCSIRVKSMGCIY